eukprot:jgi/Mesvir1/19395/Mv10429-RA.1
MARKHSPTFVRETLKRGELGTTPSPRSRKSFRAKPGTLIPLAVRITHAHTQSRSKRGIFCHFAELHAELLTVIGLERLFVIDPAIIESTPSDQETSTVAQGRVRFPRRNPGLRYPGLKNIVGRGDLWQQHARGASLSSASVYSARKSIAPKGRGGSLAPLNSAQNRIARIRPALRSFVSAPCGKELTRLHAKCVPQRKHTGGVRADGEAKQFNNINDLRSRKVSDIDDWGPSLYLTAEECIAKQLDALRQNNHPYIDHGIEVMYRWADFDPFQRSRYFGRSFDLGQFERFRRIMHHDAYRCLLGLTDYRVLSSLQVDEMTFRQRVWVKGWRHNEEDEFSFTMRQRLGGHKDGYWFTTELVNDAKDLTDANIVY